MVDSVGLGPASKTTSKLARFGDRAQLVILVGEGAGRSFTLGADPVVLGRDESATIRFTSEGISREHARITRPKSSFIIEDLGSSNGTRVNGVPLGDRASLQYGDRIQLGAAAILVFTRYSELEDQLNQIQKLDSIGVLASGLAHDFGNVMTIVASNLEYLLDKLEQRHPEESDLLDCLRDTSDASNRGMELVRRLTGFARRKPSEATVLQLSELVDGVVKLVEPALPPNIDLAVQLDDSDISIVGERGPLEQVLLNLCLNARDAMPDGGKLRITGSLTEVQPIHDLSRLMVSPGHFALLEVKDTGGGMSERTRRQIFEPFYTTKGERGTGLGLAMSYSTVRNHGGNILVHSKLGEGSTFRVYLPAHRPLTPRSKTTTGPNAKI